jgi:uncharacterized protein (TIGR02452 family)
MLIDRKRAAELGRETVKILEQCHYQTEAGTVVDIRQLIESAVQNTRSYSPDEIIPDVHPSSHQTRIYVNNETTLTAANGLIENGQKTVALNFASAKNPGGGFLSGARAQEESLARSSALVACLTGQPMYEFHRSQSNPMYSDYVIYSPGVPVFRADEGTLLEEPYLCDFITCPAVNAKAVLERDPSRKAEIHEVMRKRIARMLSIAALHTPDALILGAWGCGAFGNDTKEIAGLFNDALSGEYSGVFDTIVFAITDWSEESKFIGPFQHLFGDRG